VRASFLFSTHWTAPRRIVWTSCLLVWCPSARWPTACYWKPTNPWLVRCVIRTTISTRIYYSIWTDTRERARERVFVRFAPHTHARFSNVFARRTLFIIRGRRTAGCRDGKGTGEKSARKTGYDDGQVYVRDTGWRKTSVKRDDENVQWTRRVLAAVWRRLVCDGHGATCVRDGGGGDGDDGRWVRARAFACTTASPQGGGSDGTGELARARRRAITTTAMAARRYGVCAGRGNCRENRRRFS